MTKDVFALVRIRCGEEIRLKIGNEVGSRFREIRFLSDDKSWGVVRRVISIAAMDALKFHFWVLTPFKY